MEHLVAHAVKLLTARPQSRMELQMKLNRMCANRQRSKLLRFRQPFEGVCCNSAVSQAMDELAKMSLIDDAHYATWHVEQREKYRPRSRLQLRGELAAKGVPSALSIDAVSDVDDIAAALAVARRKPRASGDTLIGFLARKGFPPQVAVRVARQIDTERSAANPGPFGNDDDSNAPER